MVTIAIYPVCEIVLEGKKNFSLSAQIATNLKLTQNVMNDDVDEFRVGRVFAQKKGFSAVFYLRSMFESS